jgi:hypothetical protein
MIVLLWFLNMVISWFNAWGCGKTWAETRANGGMPHFLNWMGAIMSASGFTWCYTVLACVLGGGITHTVGGRVVPYLSQAQVGAVAGLGYMMVIFPILGSGLAITLHSWGVFWRRRSLGSGAVAGWNTFAQVSNIYNAVQDIPQVWDMLGGFFGFGSKSKSTDSSSDKNGTVLVIAIAAFALLAGVLTTYTILTSTARATARERGMKYARVA